MSEHLLVTIGKERFANPVMQTVRFVDDKVQNDFLNDIENVWRTNDGLFNTI